MGHDEHGFGPCKDPAEGAAQVFWIEGVEAFVEYPEVRPLEQGTGDVKPTSLAM
jgi:hypothetical protein